MTAEQLRLTMAISEYDHVQDIVSGRIVPDGISLRCLNLILEEIFYRFIKFSEWDISEMSCGRYVSLLSNGDPAMVAIPVFPSRMHRFHSIFTRSDGPNEIAQLRGLRVGIPEWAQTASIYFIGTLVHEFDISLDEIQWYQAGINQAGREELVEVNWPIGIGYMSRPDSTLDQLLLAGEIDAAFCPRPPNSFVNGDQRIRHLYTDYQQIEQEYWQRTGVFPIMHTVAVRRDVLLHNSWVARSLQSAFEEARDRSVERLFDPTVSRLPLPWAAEDAADVAHLFSGSYWPYGIDKNRKTLEVFLQYAHEQGVTRRRLSVEEMFPATEQ